MHHQTDLIEFNDGRLPITRRAYQIIRFTLLFVVITAIVGGAAAAKEPPLITVAPEQASGSGYKTASFFELEGEPGQTVRAGRLTVDNPRDKQVRVALDSVDAQTAKNLGFAYDVRGLKIHGPSRWTKLDERKLTIAPKKSATVDFTVEIPASAKPGDYLSGISVQALDQEAKQNSDSKVGVSSVQRYVIGVLVATPGPRNPLIKFTGASVERFPAGVTFVLKARNAGNVILRKVHGSAEVFQGKKKILSAKIPKGTFVTGTSIEYPLLAKQQQPKEGTVFRVKAVLRYKGGVARLDESVRFGKKQAKLQEEFAAPEDKGGGIPGWAWGLFGLLAALIIGAAIYLIRRHRSRRILDRAAGLALLKHELDNIGESGQPVSITVLLRVPTEKDIRQKLLDTLTTRLHSSNTLCELDDRKLLVISPDTGGEAAAGLAAEIGRTLARVEGLGEEAPKVGSATAEQKTDAEKLIEEASATAG